MGRTVRGWVTSGSFVINFSRHAFEDIENIMQTCKYRENEDRKALANEWCIELIKVDQNVDCYLKDIYIY